MRRAAAANETCALRRSGSEPEAFTEVYETLAMGVLRFLAKRTLDGEVARDLTAETFALAYRGRRRFRGRTDAEASGWIFSIARHLLSHYVRSGIVERKATERLGIQLSAISESDHERVVELVGLESERARIAQELTRLARDQQDAIQLRVIDELPYAEVAARLRVSEPTARARVSRGLRVLAATLESAPSPLCLEETTS